MKTVAQKTAPATRRTPRNSPAGKNADALNLVPLQQPIRSTQVAEQLTETILDGKLKPNELLPPERVLAAQLGVSRNVVREAVKVLQSRGLLTIRHGVGILVNETSSEPLQHAFTQALHGQADALLKLTEVRLLVEVEMASLAAQRGTKADLKKIRRAFEGMEATVDEPREYVNFDREFHSALAAATQNTVFALVMEATAALTREARVYSLKAGASLDESLRIHRAILEAVESRDATAAAAHMHEHLKIVEADIKRGRRQK
jgi:GntR family transcriptional repressor for pyruvate dehydrogenase complex